MRILKVKSCKECPLRLQARSIVAVFGELDCCYHFYYKPKMVCFILQIAGKITPHSPLDYKIDKRTKTFPRFCPLEKGET